MYSRQVTLFVGGFISQPLTILSVLGQGSLVIQRFGKSELGGQVCFATVDCRVFLVV